VASILVQALWHGVTRSKRRAMQCMRQAADSGDDGACLALAHAMYADRPHARKVGRVGEAAVDAGATPAAVMEGHDVPADVLSDVVHWLRIGGCSDPSDALDGLRVRALEGAMYCYNASCEVVGQLKDFKVCRECRTARYCGDACQRDDWFAGGHKDVCGHEPACLRL
jgi:hypothetical protein